MPDGPTFGGGATSSLISPLALILLVLFAVLLLVLPRRLMIAPLLLANFLIPISQQLVLVGVHWFPARIIVLIAAARLLVAGFPKDESQTNRRFGPLDHAVTIYIVAQVFAVCLYYQSTAAVVNQLGYMIDALLCYVVLRLLIRDEQDMYRALKCLAVICVLIGVEMFVEQITRRNIFGIIYPGFAATPELRDDKIRSQGTFAHALMAGSFAGMIVPLFFLMWKNAVSKVWGMLGFFGATAMMLTSNSSTPLLAYAASILGLCLWTIRKRMRTVRWGIVAALTGLAVVMKAPVWFVIAHIDLTGSSSGYHRAALVDQFINHFRDWWLIGTSNSANWGWDMWDQQNQYVNIGESGGLLAFIFFILVIVRGFRMLGNARKSVDGKSSEEWLFWCLGCSLFANVVAFFGVNYFDQSKVGWFTLLAMIAAVSQPASVTDPIGARIELQRKSLVVPRNSRLVVKNATFRKLKKIVNQ
jgi:hypothetical protein